MFKTDKKTVLILTVLLVLGMCTISVMAYEVPDNWWQGPTASELGITEFNQAPMLEERVEAGELEPLTERLPDDPLVIEPLNEVGKYGGTLVAATRGPGSYGATHYARHCYFFSMDPSITKVVPEVAAGYELSDDSKELTIYLRKGLKWSDGHPFTTEDVMFWYNHVVLNKDLPERGNWWRVGGELAEFEAVNDHELKITFAKPYRPVKGMLNYWATQQTVFYEPAHYMKKYHKDFNPDIDELVEEEGFDTWVQLYSHHRDTSPGQQDLNIPVLGAWVLKERNSTRKVFERNPYYWAVDTEGNQLPYIDRLETRLIADKEVRTMEAIQGNLDIAGMGLEAAQYPMYKKNEGNGDYRVLPWQSAKSAEVVYAFNLNHEDPVMREIFQDVRFRRAMSLAINREEVNQFVYLGTGTPCQITVHPGVTYFEDWWAESYAEYNPERANELLDEMGLKKGPDGFRMRPDGKELKIVLENAGRGRDEANELIIQHWKEVGVKVDYKQISRELYEQHLKSNDHDMGVWEADRMQELRAYIPEMTKYTMDVRSLRYATGWQNWNDWQKWHKGGEKGMEPPKGIEPPAYVKEYFDLLDSWYSAQSQEEYTKLAKEIWSFHAENLWLIGTVARKIAPVIISNDVQNVPEDVPFSDGTSWWRVGKPAQWYKK